MPNGMSGHFNVTRTELGQLINGFDGETIVGKSSNPITASAMNKLLQEWVGDEVFISQQDHTWYIVHLSQPSQHIDPDCERWIIVNGASPLYEGLHRCHAAWLDEVRKRLLGS